MTAASHRSVPQVGLLDLIQLATPDVAGAVAFYRDILGATVIEEALPWWGRVRIANIDLGLHQGVAPAGEGGAEPAFRVPDVAAFRAHLQAAGVTITQDYHDIPGGVKLGFADPAGNRLAVIQYGTNEAAIRG